jgi:hypothetical protein
MKKIILSAVIATIAISLHAQKLFTKNGNISFFSKTAVENIDATSNQVTSVFVATTGDIQFSVLIKSFHFPKALMEEHFNENYMESEKFPKATFKGKIADISKVNFTKDGAYPVSVSGDMNMHGVTKKVTTTGTITVKGGVPSATASFDVKLADYGINIPTVVKSNIAETVNIKVNCSYTQKM